MPVEVEFVVQGVFERDVRPGIRRLGGVVLSGNVCTRAVDSGHAAIRTVAEAVAEL